MDSFDIINDILAGVNINNVTAESNEKAKDLPDGYYLCEVETAELTESKSSQLPMVKLQFKVVEDGLTFDVDQKGISHKLPLSNTKNRKVFMYYVLKDVPSAEKMISDMLKFEGENAGVPLLEKGYFANAELIADALDVIIGCQIYVHLSTTTNKNGEANQWKNLVSWATASKMELF